MASRSGSRKKSGSTRSGDARDENLLINELRERVTVLENELLLKQSDTTSRDTIDRKLMGEYHVLFQRMVDNAADMVFLLGPMGRIMYVNEAVCKALGYTREELLSMTVFDLNQIHHEDNWLEHEEKLKKQGSMTFENVLKTKDGRLIPVENSANYARLGDEEYNYSFVRDITERKQAEAALLESEASRKVAEAVEAERRRLFDVLETLPAMVCLLTPDYHVAFANRSFREKFGESRGLHCYEYCFGRAEPCDFCESFKVLKTGHPHHWEVTGPDGSTIDVHDFPFTDVDGTPMILEMDIDITERKRIEQALRKSESWFRQLSESLPELVWACRADGPCDYLSPQWVSYTGVPEERQLGYGWLDQVHPDDRERVAREWALASARGEVFDTEFRIRRHDGVHRWFKTRAIPLKDENGAVARWFGSNTDIDDMKITTDALKESETRYRQLFNSDMIGIAFPDKYGGYSDGNDEFLRIIGYNRDDLAAGRVRWDLMTPPEYARLDEERVAESLARGTCTPYEKEYIRKDGSRVPILIGYTLLEGSKDQYIAFVLDITERKRSEAALRENKERYRLVVAGARGAIWDWDVPNKRVFFSQQWKEMRGFSDDEISDREEEWSSRIHPEDAPRVLAAVQAHFEGKTPVFAEEYRTLCKDGSWKWIADRGMAQRDDQGNVVRMAGSENDITERKRAEEALKKSEEHLAADLAAVTGIQAISQSYLREGDLNALLDDIMGVAVAIAGTDKGTLQLIKPGSDHLDIKTQRGFGQDYIDFFSSVSHGTAAVCGTAFSRGERVVVDDVEKSPIFVGTPALDVQRKAGVRAVQSTPIVNRRGEMIGMLSTHWSKPGRPGDDVLRYMDLLASQAADIIERKRAEEALKEAKQQAELYLDLMGHDISNMHQIILGQLQLAEELLGEGGRLECEDKELIDTSIQNLLRSAKLIDNVRNLQKLQAGEFSLEPVDLDEVLNDAVAAYSNITDKTVTIDYNPAHGHIINVNPVIKEVFNNIIDNAVKHSGAPVRIGIAVSHVERSGRQYHRVSIEDNGPGIPDEKKEEVFHRLKRGQTKARGTGLGLYLVKTLVESFGGIVELEDRIEGDYSKGSRFLVYLPAAEGENNG